EADRSVVVDGAWREHGREPEEVEALVVEVRLRGLVAARLGVVVVGVVRLVEPLDVRVRELLRGVVRGGVLEVAGQRDGGARRSRSATWALSAAVAASRRLAAAFSSASASACLARAACSSAAARSRLA